MFSLTKHIKSYFAETSLHGLKYIGEEGRVTLERLLWIILVSSGVVLAVVFMLPGITILQSYHFLSLVQCPGINKYIHSPTSTSLDTRDYPVYEISLFVAI